MDPRERATVADPQISRPRPVPGGVCSRIYDGVDVDASGNAYLCCITCVDDCATSLRLGNVFEQGLEAVVDGPVARRLRALHYAGGLSQVCCGHCDQAESAEPGTAPAADAVERLGFLEVELTPRCNLACTMCVHTFRAWERQPLHVDVERNADIDLGRFRALVDEFRGLHRHPKEVRLQWLGEPLLHPSFLACLEHTTGDPSTVAVVTTNAALLDREVTFAVLDLPGPMRFEFSVNAASRDSYRAVTGAEGYAQVVTNVRRFLERRHHLGREDDVAVRIKMLAMPETAGEVDSFLDSWRRELDDQGSPHATWWDNRGPRAPTVLCVNSLFAHGFLPATDLLERARGARGPMAADAQLFVAQYLERFVGRRPASWIRTRVLAPLDRFLGATGASDTPLLEVQRVALEVSQQLEEGGSVTAALRGLETALEGLESGGGPISNEAWIHLSVVVRERFRAMRDRGRSAVVPVAILDGIARALLDTAGSWDPVVAEVALRPLLRDVVLPGAGRRRTAQQRGGWISSVRAHVVRAGEEVPEFGDWWVAAFDAVAAATDSTSSAGGERCLDGLLEARTPRTPSGWFDACHAVAGLAGSFAVDVADGPQSNARSRLDLLVESLLQAAVEQPAEAAASAAIDLVRGYLLPTAGVAAPRGRTARIGGALERLAERWGEAAGPVVPALPAAWYARATACRRSSVEEVAVGLDGLCSALDTPGAAITQAERDALLSLVVPIDVVLPPTERWAAATARLDRAYDVIASRCTAPATPGEPGLTVPDVVPAGRGETAVPIPLPPAFPRDLLLRVRVGDSWGGTLYAAELPAAGGAPRLSMDLAQLVPGAYSLDLAAGLQSIRAVVRVRANRPREVFGLAALEPRIRFRDALPDGARVVRVARHEALELSIPYALPLGAVAPQFGLAVIAQDGTVVHGPNSALLRVDTRGVPPAGEAVFAVAAPRLLPGRYRVAGGVFDRPGDRCWSFAPRLGELVVGPASGAAGGVDLRARWV